MNRKRGQLSTIAIVLLVVGLVVGAGGIYFVLSNTLRARNTFEQKTRDYEATTLAMEQVITTYEDRVTGYESQVTDLEGEITDYNSQIADLNEDITGYESEIADLETEKSIHEQKIKDYEATQAASVHILSVYESQVLSLREELENLNDTYQNLILEYSSVFVVSDMVINPEEVEINQPVKISVTVKNIGGLEGSYVLELKIGDVLEASKEVTLIGGESVTTSFDVVKDEASTYNFTLNGFSGTFNVIRPLWCEIGVPYVASDGLTVTLISLTITEKVGSYQYTILYILKNEQLDRSIDEGTFKMYGEFATLPQYGFFGILFPGDSLSRGYTFEELKDKPFAILVYHHEQFFNAVPPEESLKWKVEIP